MAKNKRFTDAFIKKFLKLKRNHGIPYVCRELDITVDEYNELCRLASEKDYL